MNQLSEKYVRAWDSKIHVYVTRDIPLDSNASANDGALMDVHIGVKDIIDVKGVPTRNGSEACRDAEPARQDADVVAKLRDAGAVLTGKTTSTEFAYSDPSICRNPYDVTRTPGGSSSGSGAGVAVELFDAALGTQTAGSICRPAAYCGAVGFKPSFGQLSTKGVTPMAPSFDTVGVIASSVAMARRVYAVLAPAQVAAASARALGLKAIEAVFDTSVTAEPETARALQEAGAALAGLGAQLTRESLHAPAEEIVVQHRCVMDFEAFSAHGAMLADARADVLKPNFLNALQAGARIQEDDAQIAREYLKKEKAAFWDRYRDVSVFVTLPVPDAAPELGGTTGFQGWLTPWTVFGGPLISLPWGLDSLGRPRAVMLAARPGWDYELLDIASQLEQRAPELPRPAL